MKCRIPTSMILCCAMALANAQTSPAPTNISSELQKLFDDDQADRTSDANTPADWAAMNLRDEARQARVAELIKADALHTGADYYHAALILQHGYEPNDFLLAHDLCVISISKGESRAKWLAAATLDRFLGSIGRPQRYGTQSKRRFPHPSRLAPVDPDVPDSLRREMDVPSLAEARAKEAKVIEAFEASQRAKQQGQAGSK